MAQKRNIDNITPHNFRKISKEKQRSIASQGGYAAAAKRKAMVKLSECVTFIMSQPLQGKENDTFNKLLGTTGVQYTQAMATISGVVNQARKGNVKAAYLVAQLMGDLTEKVETTTSITATALASAKVDELTDEEVEAQLKMLRAGNDGRGEE